MVSRILVVEIRNRMAVEMVREKARPSVGQVGSNLR